MTIGATHDFASGCELVRVGERESRRAVVEFSVGPDGDGVAVGAGGGGSGEIGGDVIGNVAAKGGG